jgi:hypothetical protein
MNSLRGIIRSARRRGEHLSTWPVYTPIWRDASVRRSRNYQSAHLDKFAHLVDRRDGVMSARLLIWNLGAADEARVRNNLAGANETVP